MQPPKMARTSPRTNQNQVGWDPVLRILFPHRNLTQGPLGNVSTLPLLEKYARRPHFEIVAAWDHGIYGI